MSEREEQAAASASGRRTFGWIQAISASVAVAAWLALVLAYQYEIAWLNDYVLASDALFLAGVVGIALTLSVERWGAARVRPVALRLAFSIAVFAGAVAVAEFAARYVLPGAISSDGPHISLNSLGFREREIGPKDPSRYRIVIIGDSFTFGNGVEESDRFSNLLAEFLGPQYEVLNLGHPGNNLPEHLDKLDQALKMSPNFVLLQLYENDFETSTMKRRRPRSYTLLPLDLDRRIEQSSLLYRLLVDRWIQLQEAVGLAEGYTDFMARHLRDPDSAESREMFGLLPQFIDRARAAGVPNGAVLFPALYGLGPDASNYPFAYMNDRIKNIYADWQVPYLDLLPAFSTVDDPRSMWVSPFDSHPNAKANRLAAVAILNQFLPAWHH